MRHRGAGQTVSLTPACQRGLGGEGCLTTLSATLIFRVATLFLRRRHGFVDADPLAIDFELPGVPASRFVLAISLDRVG